MHTGPDFPLNLDIQIPALGTGIGTAALVDGRLLRGSRGLIEGGHMVW